MVPAHQVPAYQPPARVIEVEEVWQPLPTYTPLEPQEASDCARCGARELVERDFDGDVEFVCVNGHRRYGRSLEELEAVLEYDSESASGKLRRRKPSINGLRLG